MSLSLEEQRRYARQIQLPEFGETSQLALKSARVLVVGAGGLGASLLSYLSAAGIGTLGIVDGDRVELSNLNRQILHETGDIGRLKAESARDRVEELNPLVHVNCHDMNINVSNAEALIAQYDIVADGCDNFATRMVVNRTCVELKKPLVSAAVKGWDGQISTFAPHLAPHAPCYQCLVAEDAPEINTCKEAGVIGPLCGIMGSMQALEVMYTILGDPQWVGKLCIFNSRTGMQRVSAITQDPACKVCNGPIA